MTVSFQTVSLFFCIALVHLALIATFTPVDHEVSEAFSTIRDGITDPITVANVAKREDVEVIEPSDASFLLRPEREEIAVVEETIPSEPADPVAIARPASDPYSVRVRPPQLEWPEEAPEPFVEASARPAFQSDEPRREMRSIRAIPRS